MYRTNTMTVPKSVQNDNNILDQKVVLYSLISEYNESND